MTPRCRRGTLGTGEAGHFLRALGALQRWGHEVPWARIGAATYGLGQLTEALAAAERLAIPKALVDPWRE